MKSRKNEREFLKELKMIRQELYNMNENLRSLVNIKMMQNAPNLGNPVYPWKPPYEITSTAKKD